MICSASLFFFFLFQCICCLFVLFIEIFVTSSVTAMWLCILLPPRNNKDVFAVLVLRLFFTLQHEKGPEKVGMGCKNNYHFTLKGTGKDVRHLIAYMIVELSRNYQH